jgi:hypothetical protein
MQPLMSYEASPVCERAAFDARKAIQNSGALLSDVS